MRERMERKVLDWAAARASHAEQTLCVRGMRDDSTTMALTRFIESSMFGGEFDFLHVPIDFRSKKSIGYAFINFPHLDTARRFAEFIKAGWCSGFAANSDMHAVPSRKQGLAECLISWCQSHSRSVRSPEVFPFVRSLNPNMPVDPRVYLWTPNTEDIPMPAFVRSLEGPLQSRADMDSDVLWSESADGPIVYSFSC